MMRKTGASRRGMSGVVLQTGRVLTRCALVLTTLAVILTTLSVILTTLAGCGRPPAETSRPAAPVGLRATVVIEPPRMEIGETARVELVVVTPPGQQVAPVAPPDELQGVWVLATETPSVDRSASRWVHRMGYQIRAKATGRFAWPVQEVEVRAPDGTTVTAVTTERPFEIAEISAEYPGQLSFFSFRTLDPVDTDRGPWLPALGGALATLFGVALVALVRHSRRGDHASPAGSGAVAPSARRSSLAALAAARELTETDLLRAADMASSALRLYGAGRYALPMLTCTTEELAQKSPPVSLGDRWCEWLRVLRELDGVRFLPADHPRAAAVEEVIDRARTLVSEGAPR